MKINNYNKLLYLFLSLTLFLDLYFNIDTAGSGGYIIDFNSTWPLVENPLSYKTNLDFKFPLHYYIAAAIFKLVNNKEILRFVYCLLALPIPYLFFLSLSIKFKKIDLNNLFLFSLIIFLLPSFRSAAVWPNTQITGIFFFLVSLYYFLKWEEKKKFNILNKEILLTVIFMSLTVYSRQLYAMIFFYFMIIFYQKLTKKLFFKLSFIVSLFAIPGIIFVIFLPKILKVTFEFKLYNSLLVNSSIISFYLIPFFLILYIFEKKINLFKNIKLILPFIIFFVFICSSFFNYNYLMGGGYFIKLSKILFNNFYFFYLTSIVGFYLIYILSKEDNRNLILNLIVLFSISAFIIFMKYFEPMYLLILFLLFNTKLTSLFLKNKKYIYLYLSYFLFYLATAILNNYYLFSKNI